MRIVVFTKPESMGFCPQCVRAKNFLKSKGAEFLEQDITDSPIIEKLREDNTINMAPVVALVDDASDEVLSFHVGFVPDKINEIVKAQKEGSVLVGASAVNSSDIWDF